MPKAEEGVKRKPEKSAKESESRRSLDKREVRSRPLWTSRADFQSEGGGKVGATPVLRQVPRASRYGRIALSIY